MPSDLLDKKLAAIILSVISLSEGLSELQGDINYLEELSTLQITRAIIESM